MFRPIDLTPIPMNFPGRFASTGAYKIPYKVPKFFWHCQLEMRISKISTPKTKIWLWTHRQKRFYFSQCLSNWVKTNASVIFRLLCIYKHKTTSLTVGPLYMEVHFILKVFKIFSIKIFHNWFKTSFQHPITLKTCLLIRKYIFDQGKCY
jgi:hypothetical protein